MVPFVLLSGSLKRAIFRPSWWLLHLGPLLHLSQDMGIWAARRSPVESLLQHYAHFALEVFENKGFLPILQLREVDIAPSWDVDGSRHRQSRNTEGRQQQWYKDFWHLPSQRWWRLLGFRAARTVRRSRSPLTRPHSKLSNTTGWSINLQTPGRVGRLARTLPFQKEGSHG